MKYFKDRLPLILKKYPKAWAVILVPDERQDKNLYKLLKLSDLSVSDKWYNVIKDFLEIRESGNNNIWARYGGDMTSFYDNKSDEIMVRIVHVAPRKNTLIDLLRRLGDAKKMQETPLKPETRKHFGDIIDNFENI